MLFKQIPCFATAIQGSGCGLSDIKCQCTTGAEKIAASLATCAPQKCSESEIASTSLHIYISVTSI